MMEPSTDGHTDWPLRDDEGLERNEAQALERDTRLRAHELALAHGLDEAPAHGHDEVLVHGHDEALEHLAPNTLSWALDHSAIQILPWGQPC